VTRDLIMRLKLTTTQLLTGVLLLQTGAILGTTILPSAAADEPRPENRFGSFSTSSSFESTTPAIQPRAVENPSDLTCKHFSLDGESIAGTDGAQFETADMDSPIGSWVHPLEQAGWETFSTDFEMGATISGRPMWWVQVCMSKEQDNTL
jgi:hypothetical protein